MILSNIKYGKVIIPTLLEFGKGDIAVTWGVNETETENHVAVIFKNQSPREIGEIGDLLKGQTTDETFTDMVMVFDNENSIDVVMRKLQAAKDELHKIILTPTT